MRWMIRRPDLVHRLPETATDYEGRAVTLLAERFDPADMLIYVAAPTASNQMISPKMFERFVLPYKKALHSHALAAGIGHIFCHICGEQNRNLPLWKQVPMGDPGIVSSGHEVDLSDAVAYFGDSCIIAGNVAPAVIHPGPPEKIYSLCMEALEKGTGAPGGFVLMPGCGMPPGVPAYHAYLMKKALKDFLARGNPRGGKDDTV